MHTVGHTYKYLMEKRADVSGLAPYRAHQVLVEVYGNTFHKNGGTKLDGRVAYDTL